MLSTSPFSEDAIIGELPQEIQQGYRDTCEFIFNGAVPPAITKNITPVNILSTELHKLIRLDNCIYLFIACLEYLMKRVIVNELLGNLQVPMLTEGDHGDYNKIAFKPLSDKYHWHRLKPLSLHDYLQPTKR